MANHLAERANHLDWHVITEQLAVKILEKHRAGEPVIELVDHEASERVGHRLMPLLQERQASLLFGHGDTGKSWVGVLAGVLVASGLHHVGFTPQQGSVLYLDFETDEDTVFERATMVAKGLDIGLPNGLHYRYMSQLLAGDIEAIQKHVLEKEISLLVIDSAAPAVGEPESAQMTSDYFRALRSLKVTTLTTAHVAKTGKETEPFGSIFWHNLPRSNFRVNGVHEPGASTFVVGLKNTKSNNAQRLKDIALELTFTQDAVYFDRVDIKSIPELAGAASLKERIEISLGNGAKTVKDLAEDVGASPGTVRDKLNQFKDRDFIQLDSDNREKKWGLLVSEADLL